MIRKEEGGNRGQASERFARRTRDVQSGKRLVRLSTFDEMNVSVPSNDSVLPLFDVRVSIIHLFF